MEFLEKKKADLSEIAETLEYVLIKSPRDSVCFCKERCVFSLLCLSFENEDICDKNFLYDISSDENTADGIFKIISSGKVTPSTLKDVVYDLLSEGEWQK